MAHHGKGLFRLTKNDALVAALKRDHRDADIDQRDRAMLIYAEKLTRDPCACTREDVDALREHGFADADVLDIAQVTAYYGYVNRMACGLGVELEPYWDNE